MGILGNMQLLSLCSCVLTSYTYQNGYCECGSSQRYHYGMFAMHKLLFVAQKFRLRRVQKNGKKEQKIENRVLQKTLFYFSMFTSWKWFGRLIWVKKMAWGRCPLQKNFWNFLIYEYFCLFSKTHICKPN